MSVLLVLRLTVLTILLAISSVGMAGVTKTLALPKGQEEFGGQPYSCQGTEPFWHMNMNYEYFDYSDPTSKSLKMNATDPHFADGQSRDSIVVFQTHTLGKWKTPVTIVMEKAPKSGCNYGITNINYPYSIILIFPQRVVLGCCAPQTAQNGPTPANVF